MKIPVMIVGAAALAYIAYKWKTNSSFKGLRYGAVPGANFPGLHRYGYFGKAANPGQGALDAVNTVPATPFQYRTLGNPNDQQAGSR